MTLSTRLRRTVSLAGITAVAGTAALAGSASAATIQKAPVLQPGATIPVDFPGYTEPANNKLKANYRILVVRAEVARGERPSTIITAPKGFKLVALGFSDDARRLGGRADNHYVGKRVRPPDPGREPQRGRRRPDGPRDDLRARAARLVTVSPEAVAAPGAGRSDPPAPRACGLTRLGRSRCGPGPAGSRTPCGRASRRRPGRRGR